MNIANRHLLLLLGQGSACF